MKLSQLETLIIAAGEDKDSEIRSLDAFVQDAKNLAKYGTTHGRKKTETDDPDVSIRDYVAYADSMNKRHSNKLVTIPDKKYLDGSSPGVRIFQAWKKNDLDLKKAAEEKKDESTTTTEQKKAKPYTSQTTDAHLKNLDKWLDRELSEKIKGLSGETFGAYLKKDLKELSIHLENLATRRIEAQKSGREGQDEFNRLETEIKFIALLIGYKNAARTINDHAAAKALNPTANIDIYMLKRHEASENVHKGFGLLNKDTGLTAVDASILTKQTEHDLQVTQMIHSAYAEALKASGLINYIKQHVSPVRRAWQTAVKAVFKPNIADETVVSSVNCETKHGHWTKRKASRSANTRSRNKGLRPMLEELEKNCHNVKIDDNAFNELPSDDANQDKRVGKAVKDFFLSPSPKPGSTLHVQVSHGGVIFDQMSELDQMCLDNDIPSTIPTGKVGMKFGDFKTVCIARDENNEKILAVSGGSTFTRDGMERLAATPALMKVSEFKKKTKPDKSTEKPQVQNIESTPKKQTKAAKLKKPEAVQKIENTLRMCHPSSIKQIIKAKIFRTKGIPTTPESRSQARQVLEDLVNAAITSSKTENSDLKPYISVLNKLNKQVDAVKAAQLQMKDATISSALLQRPTSR